MLTCRPNHFQVRDADESQAADPDERDSVPACESVEVMVLDAVADLDGCKP